MVTTYFQWTHSNQKVFFCAAPQHYIQINISILTVNQSSYITLVLTTSSQPCLILLSNDPTQKVWSSEDFLSFFSYLHFSFFSLSIFSFPFFFLFYCFSFLFSFPFFFFCFLIFSFHFFYFYFFWYFYACLFFTSFNFDFFSCLFPLPSSLFLACVPNNWITAMSFPFLNLALDFHLEIRCKFLTCDLPSTTAGH